MANMGGDNRGVRVGGSRGGKNRFLTLGKFDCCERRGESDDHRSGSEKI